MGTFLCKDDSENTTRLSTINNNINTSYCSTSRRTSSSTPFPQQNFFVFDQLCFDSRFESGNLLHAEKAAPNIYNLWIAPDCCRTQHETNNKVWFYFSVTNIILPAEESAVIPFTFKLKNMSKCMHQNFLNGMVPVYSSKTTNNEWKYLPTPLTDFHLIKNSLEVTFEYRFTPQDTEAPVYFAFTFPYTYTTCQEFLNKLDKAYAEHPDIYYKRELLTHSLEGRNIDLLTITAQDPTHDSPETEPQIPTLFPSHTANNDTRSSEDFENITNSPTKRPYIFRKKKYILITCRSRACEAPSNYLLEGFINSLLNQSDCVSRILLQDFVFVIIPMLNPDGVFRGHYKTDNKGNDLDRIYDTLNEEKRKEFPSASALVSLAQSLGDGRLVMYMDLHTESGNNGAFLLGNHQEDVMDQTDVRLFAALCDIYSNVFDIRNCGFEKKEAKDSKKGRNAKSEIGRLTNLPHCYRIGTGYYKGTKDPERYSPDNKERNLLREVEGILDTKSFEEFGKDIRHVLLEVFTEHPVSKVTKTWYKSLQNLKNVIYEGLMQKAKGNSGSEEGHPLEWLKY